MYAQDSIELLTTSGIQFKKHEDEGIETLFFAELLMTSGVVLCDGVKWLSFHRYDEGLLVEARHPRWTMAPDLIFLSGSGMALAPIRVLFKLLSYLSCSGYDFGYLIKILSNANLPEEEVDFFEILRLYFPVIYDVKYLMKSCKSLKVTPFIYPKHSFISLGT